MNPARTPQICILVSNLDAQTGGIQRNTRLLIREFGERGAIVSVCTRNYHGLPREETIDGARVRRSPVVGNSKALNGILYLFDTFLWLIRNRQKYDVIHCQQMFGPTMAAAAASFFVRKPIVTRITLSGETGEAMAIRQMPLARLRMRLIRRVTRWVALTKEMKTELESLGISPERIRIIHNSTEITRVASYEGASRKEWRELLGLRHGKIGVFVGRLSEEKNLDILIRAWQGVRKKYVDAHLLLLGSGGEYRNVESRLRELTEQLGLGERVSFIGHVENAKEYVLASDVFILPTRAEGMSNALVEAFACGATIVATDIPANREICVHRENALLVPPGDAGALGNAVLEALDCPELAERLGRAAREKAERELSVDTMVSNYLDTYRDAVSETVI